MTTQSTRAAHRPLPTPEPAGRRAALAPWLAGLWSATYLALAALHLLRDTGAPWTPNPAAVLGSLSESAGSVLVIVLAGLGLAGLALRARSPRSAAAVLTVTGLVVALVLADARSLAFLGYLPMLLLGLVGVGPATDVAPSILTASLASVGESVGGLALVLTGVATWRTSSPGRFAPSPANAATAARVCRWAVAVAIAVPAFYAATRLAWALGIPFGVREQFLVDLGSAKFAGLGLGLAALVGCLLTSGLISRWGETLWSWLPVVGGRPVPVRMAVFPAIFVASVVFSAGLAFWRLVLLGQIEETPGTAADWAAWVPELFWPLWGVALAVAGLAYGVRRSSER